MIPHCLMWVIWRERNARTFEGIERSIHELKLYSFYFYFFWLCMIGQCFGCLFFHFFIWYAWFLYLLCYLIFSMLLLADGLCASFFCIFSHHFSINFSTCQKKKCARFPPPLNVFWSCKTCSIKCTDNI